MTNEEKYLEYLEGHIGNVKEALELLYSYDIPFITDNIQELRSIVSKHDESKYQEPEWSGYLHHFYPSNDEESLKTEEFEAACKHHIKNNPHHWDYWIDEDNNLIEDIDEQEYKLYTVERLCDHMAMSIQNDNKPKEWYEANKNEIIMPSYGTELYEEMLNKVPDNYNLSFHGTRTENKPEREAIDESVKEDMLLLSNLLQDKIMYPIRSYRNRKDFGPGSSKKGNKYITTYYARVKGGYDVFAKSLDELQKEVNRIYDLKYGDKDHMNEQELLEARLGQLKNKTKIEDPARVKKSRNVKTTYIGMSKFGVLNFKTTSESRNGYHYQTIEFQDMKSLEDAIRKNGKVTPDDIKKEFNEGDVNVFCSDESFTYWAWYHAAYQNNYAYIDDNIPNLSKRIQAPKVNNVRLKGALCKHLYSVLDYMTRPFVLLAISDDVNKYLAGEQDKYHSNDVATQNWYDAVKDWTAENVENYLGMSRAQIVADLAKSIRIDHEIDLETFTDELAKEIIKANKGEEDPKLEKEIADKIIDELDLEKEYNRLKPEPEEVDTNDSE